MEMMTGRTLFRNYKEYDQKEVEICGWVKSNRGSKKFGFLVINDGTFFEPIQVVYDQEMDNFDTVSKLNVGTAVIVNGTVIVTPDAKQPFEIHAKSVEVEGECPSDYPLQKKRHTLEYLRSISHLRPRTNTFQAVFRVRSQIAYAIHKFFQERDFVYVHTPLITGQDCEGAGEMFQVTTMDLNKIAEEGKVDYEQDFFKKPVSLTVSGQLAGETFAQAFRNIYTFGPTFRAEDSNTTRHAAEFWMIEPEIAFADLEDNMILAEQMIKYIINYVMEHAQEELQFFNKFVDKGLLERLNHVVSSDFGRVTYTEAVKLLEEHNDEEICAKLKEVAQKENIKLAYLTGIGAAGKVTAGVFDTKEKVFKGHTWEGDLEIVSIGGNINTMNGETYTHFHISVADEAGNVYGGHLTEAVISGTGELVLTEIEGTVDRKFDEEIGLNLFEF